jgi:hypothetical protein
MRPILAFFVGVTFLHFAIHLRGTLFLESDYTEKGTDESVP